MTRSKETSQPTGLVPPAPSGFDKGKFFEGVYWHQRWQLFDGIFTPGKNSIEVMCREMNVPDNLSGKRVLDIGAWNGCLSFECERRGAREVIALGPEEPTKTGFYRLRDILGSKRTHYLVGSVYDLNPARLGYFDVVMFCGVLYHLRYPLLGIDNIRRVCTGEVFVETIVNDAQLIEDGDEGPLVVPMVDISPRLLTMPLWQFFRNDELERDPSNWFTSSTVAVLQAFESAGFEMKLLKNFGRGTFQGRVKAGVPEFLTIGSAEGGHYESITSHLLGKERLGFRDDNQQHLTAVLASAEFYGRNGNNDASWVGRVYADLLGRAPDAAEVAAALHRLREGYAGQREALVSSLLPSTGRQAHLIAGCYTHFLDRDGTETEIQYWVEVLRETSEEQVLAGFLSSEEFFLRHARSNAGWLNQVYRELLGREATPDATLDALDKGTITRDQVVLEITAGLEYYQRKKRRDEPGPRGVGAAGQTLSPAALASEDYYGAQGDAPDAWIVSLYANLFGRSSEPLELEDGLQRLRTGYALQRQILVTNLIMRLEYHMRLVATYYQKYLGRAATNRDIRFWSDLLNKAATEEQVLAGFLSSDEYFQRHGPSNADWMKHVTRELLGHATDTSLKSMLHALKKGATTRSQIVLDLIASPEHQRHWVHCLYTTYLGRRATDEELSSWTHVLRQGADERQVRAA